jgi:tRNA A-37 threonylcarbamoyl transferase component Bud32
VSAHGLESALAAPALPPELLASLAQQCAHWFGPGRVPVPGAEAKDDLALVDSPLGRLVVKRVRARGLRGALARVARSTGRAERAFRHARALAARELATPEALFVLPSACARVLGTRYVEAPHPWEFLRNGGTPDELVATLARDVARLHAAGFRHRDLKASNLLVRRAPAGLEIVWTDLDGLTRSAASPRVRARDLARLSMSFESAPARAAGLRADAWPGLARAYLAHAHGEAPSARRLERLLAATRRWRERSIRAHLARGASVR